MFRRIALAGSCVFVALTLACETRPAPPTAATSIHSTDARSGPAQDFAVEVFVDHAAATHAGPGPHPTSESGDFSLMQGGVRWLAGGVINYWIRGIEPIAGGNVVIEASEEILDAFITTRTFVRVVTGPTANPCGASTTDILDDFSTVLWGAIDGPGGALASTAVCRNVATKEIVGFLLTIDNAETWSTTGAAGTFDVANMVTHEWGHVAGLGHVNGALGGCLTMYRFGGLGETQKRTLGLGDKLGLNALYATGDTSPGPGCGN
jgi:hypothetical protein